MHKIDELGAEPMDLPALRAYRGAGPNILFVGGLRPNKGHLRALDAFAAYRQMSTRPARLFFVGSFDPHLASYVEELKTKVTDLGLESSVIFARSVTPAQLRSFYYMASAFLCVSEHEGFCVPLVESMFFRVPVVAWDTTAVGDTLGDAGILLPSAHPEPLAKALDEVIENPLLARGLADKGRERYEARFTTRAIRANLESLLDEVPR
ncbi:MAG TPA: glycosyltransferase family 4 protein, partial [Beijerinckiaceae bacterium]|nr:glycosyltransferase family 4 protein [Beijerinckiaceae bacterium]